MNVLENLKNSKITPTDRDIILLLSEADFSTQKVTGLFIALRLGRSPGNVFYRLKVLESMGYVGKSHLGTYHLMPAIKAEAVEWKEIRNTLYDNLLVKATALIRNASGHDARITASKTWSQIIFKKTGIRIGFDELLVRARLEDPNGADADKILEKMKDG